MASRPGRPRHFDSIEILSLFSERIDRFVQQMGIDCGLQGKGYYISGGIWKDRFKSLKFNNTPMGYFIPIRNLGVTI
jgi:hypothetical protein